MYFCGSVIGIDNRMRQEKSDPIYDRNTIEFVTVALEYCAFMEQAGEDGLSPFLDKTTKLLPLLYLKAGMLPIVEAEEEPEQAVTEQMYESIRSRLADLLGEHDVYLDTFHEDMRYSDTPIAAFISENLADVYQDMGNFVAAYRTGHEEVMREALAACRESFRTYWGQRLLNALKALHAVYYGEEGCDVEKEGV